MIPHFPITLVLMSWRKYITWSHYIYAGTRSYIHAIVVLLLLKYVTIKLVLIPLTSFTINLLGLWFYDELHARISLCWYRNLHMYIHSIHNYTQVWFHKSNVWSQWFFQKIIKWGQIKTFRNTEGQYFTDCWVQLLTKIIEAYLKGDKMILKGVKCPLI